MIVRKIIEPRYSVEMTVEQKETLTAAIKDLQQGTPFTIKELSDKAREALDDLRVSLLNAG